MAIDPDRQLREAALRQARHLTQLYDDMIPVATLREGFRFNGERVSFGSFYSGIYRAARQRGAAALTLVTSFNSPYLDSADETTGLFLYAYRDASPDHHDNRALDAAYEMQVPLIYFRAVAPGQYMAIEPTYVIDRDPHERLVLLQPALPMADAAGLNSSKPVLAEAVSSVKVRIGQTRFRTEVMRAYRNSCTVCTLKHPDLVQAAHITEYSELRTITDVGNGLALCAIHHLAYDRNVLGIDPGGVVHIAKGVLEQVDGPMLREGLQGFHGQSIAFPRRREDRPDRERLEERFVRFGESAA